MRLPGFEALVPVCRGTFLLGVARTPGKVRKGIFSLRLTQITYYAHLILVKW